MPSQQAPAQTPERRRLALFGTVSIFALFLFVLAYISEPPMTVVPRPNGASPDVTRAAIAIRDYVDPYQQWVSLLFALPVLKQGYKRVTYINQRSETDQENYLLQSLKTSLQENDYTDLFLLAHGSKRYIKLIKTNLPKRLTRKLRLVYNTGCGNASQGPQWLNLGVEAYVGHGGKISISPVFFFYFLRRWTKGYRLRQAIHEANWYTRQHLLLAGRLSFGLLNGPTMVGDTKAELFGNGDVQIYPPDAPPLLSQASTGQARQADPMMPQLSPAHHLHADENGAYMPKPFVHAPN